MIGLERVALISSSKGLESLGAALWLEAWVHVKAHKRSKMPSDRGVSSLKGLLKATVTDSIPTTARPWTSPHGAGGVWYPPPVCVQKGSGPICYTRGGSSIIVLIAQELEGCFICMFCRHTQIFSVRQSDLCACLHWWQLVFSTLLGMLGDLNHEITSACLTWSKSGKTPSLSCAIQKSSSDLGIFPQRWGVCLSCLESTGLPIKVSSRMIFLEYLPFGEFFLFRKEGKNISALLLF